MKPLIQLFNGIVEYNHKTILKNVSFSINENESVALIGESGSGKSTLGKALLGLVPLKQGTLLYEGIKVKKFDKELRRKGQMVFQDPYSFLNPLMKVKDIVMEPLIIHNICPAKERLTRAVALIESVGLSTELLDRYPQQLSGGQRQRIGIARALAVEPKFIILDEPFSALDLETHDIVLELLVKIKIERQLSYLLITHDLLSVSRLADFIFVMYQGEIIESGPATLVLKDPIHPYTQALRSAVAVTDPIKERSRSKLLLKGDPSSTGCDEILRGCPLFVRCPFSKPLCKDRKPILLTTDNRSVACHFVH